MASAPVPRIPVLDRIGGALIERAPGLWHRIGDLETSILAEGIATQRIEQPVYICGMARAGSTLLLELLAQAEVFTTHRYADFPLLWTPYWWNWLRARLPVPATAPVERAHQDRIAVTRNSPEALEEVLWMHFFPGRHDADIAQPLRAGCDDRGFASFYTAHIRKLLAVRNARRYLAKGNYNLSRIGYLLQLFPDARFVIAVREPIAQIASLVKQDRLFTAWSQRNPAIGRQLARSGHFEFGPYKRAENFGDSSAAAAIQACFGAGRTLEGYARQWAAAYGWLADSLGRDVPSSACIVVDYGSLCSAPAAMLTTIYQHVGVAKADSEDLVRTQAARITSPDYYSPEFTASECEDILEITNGVWQSLRQKG